MTTRATDQRSAPDGTYPAGAALQVRDVTMTYRTGRGTVRALDEVSLSVPAGGSLAIVGPSGCGKSTLLGLLAGLELPTSGEVRIGDTVVSSLPDQQRAALRRRAIGLVFQADNLQPFLTVAENVGLQAVLSGLADDPAHTSELLDALDVGELAHRFPDQLSGGQRQRVAVARALVHHPAVVLADEPTGSLDTASSGRVVDLLLRAHRVSGSTLVVVTHDHQVADRMDVVAALSAGRVTDVHGGRS